MVSQTKHTYAAPVSQLVVVCIIIDSIVTISTINITVIIIVVTVCDPLLFVAGTCWFSMQPGIMAGARRSNESVAELSSLPSVVADTSPLSRSSTAVAVGLSDVAEYTEVHSYCTQCCKRAEHTELMYIMPEFSDNVYFRNSLFCRECFDRLRLAMKLRPVTIDWCDRCKYHRILIYMPSLQMWWCEYCEWWDAHQQSTTRADN